MQSNDGKIIPYNNNGNTNTTNRMNIKNKKNIVDNINKKRINKKMLIIIIGILTLGLISAISSII